MTRSQFENLRPGDKFLFMFKTYTVSTVETTYNYDSGHPPTEVNHTINTGSPSRRLKVNDREVEQCRLL